MGELGERSCARPSFAAAAFRSERERREKREGKASRSSDLSRFIKESAPRVFLPCLVRGEESGARARYREPEPTNPSSEPAGWTLTRTPWGRTTAPPADSRAPTRARPSTSS